MGKSCCNSNTSDEKQSIGASSYRPIIAIFGVTFVMALAGSWAIYDIFDLVTIIELFVGFSMCVLAIQKLRDLESFATQFLAYDLLAQKFPIYAKIYAFAEAIVGILMISGTLMIISAPIALFIGSVGGISVYRAAYLQKRDLKCACVGGDSTVPLGAISLIENMMMVVMGLWMIAKLFII